MTFLRIQERYNLKLFQTVSFERTSNVQNQADLCGCVYRPTTLNLFWSWKLAGCVECTHGISSRAKHGTVCQLNVPIWPLIWLQVWCFTPNASMVKRLRLPIIFCRRMCRCRKYKRKTSQGKCHKFWLYGQTCWKKNAETVEPLDFHQHQKAIFAQI